MSIAAALILYPSWAIAVLLAATAARLGRSTGLGLLAVCSLLALWVTTVILVELPATRELAEHLVPLGMLQGGGYVHAGLDITGRRSRVAWIGYGWGAAVGVLGVLWPRGLYGPAMVGPGPVFWPIACASAVGAVVVVGWMAREARRRHGAARRQMVMLSAGNLFAIAAGGGALLLRVVGIAHDLRLTAPALLAGVLVIGAAVLRGEVGPARRMIVQAIAYAVMAAVITAVGITALYLGLPLLVPGSSPSSSPGPEPAIAWTLFVCALAALPLDAVRTLIVDGAGRRLFAAPIGVRDLAEQAERSEARADQAARLAEIGALVSAVAHEVRNPLGVISAHAKLLERAGAPAASLEAVRAQVQRASRFVDDLLAYGKPRPLVVRELDVRSVIDEAVAAVRAVHPGTTLAVTAGAMPSSTSEVTSGVTPGSTSEVTSGVTPGVVIDVAVEPGTRAIADRAALVDVLVNLIGNAAIAVADRGRITISATGARDLELAVSDDGPGVPHELAARLFQPFVTGRGRDHAHPGTGLGLATARSIAERHGGTLDHEAVAGGGARFVLRLPGG
jgi:signal transduction histidine kinase